MPGSPSCRYLLREVAARDAPPVKGTDPVDDCSSQFDARLGRDGKAHGEGAGRRAFAIRQSTGDGHRPLPRPPAAARPGRLSFSPGHAAAGTFSSRWTTPQCGSAASGRAGWDFDLDPRFWWRMPAAARGWRSQARSASNAAVGAAQRLWIEASDLRRAAPAADRALPVRPASIAPALVFQDPVHVEDDVPRQMSVRLQFSPRDPSRDAVGAHSRLLRIAAPARSRRRSRTSPRATLTKPARLPCPSSSHWRRCQR